MGVRRQRIGLVCALALATPLIGSAINSHADGVAAEPRDMPAAEPRDMPAAEPRGMPTAPATVATVPAKPRPVQAERRVMAVPAPIPPTNTTLLVPARVPTGSEPLRVIGAIDIAAIGLHQPLFEGVARNVIDAGPAHWEGTARPGGFGNVVIAGHRTSHTHPFHDVAALRRGDQVVFRMSDGWTYVYAVDRQFVVGNNAMWIADQHPGHSLTLFTCHPIGSSRQRLVIEGTLTASIPPAS